MNDKYFWAVAIGVMIGELLGDFIKGFIRGIKTRKECEKVKSLFLQEFEDFKKELTNIKSAPKSFKEMTPQEIDKTLERLI